MGLGGYKNNCIIPLIFGRNKFTYPLLAVNILHGPSVGLQQFQQNGHVHLLGGAQQFAIHLQLKLEGARIHEVDNGHHHIRLELVRHDQGIVHNVASLLQDIKVVRAGAEH